MAEYYKIFSLISNEDYLETVSFLKDKLSNLFVNEYYSLHSDSEIVEFEVNGYTYLFAIHSQRESATINYDSRIVAVYGFTTTSDEKRDCSRMKGFVGAFTKIDSYKAYDKGHFVAHTINGGLDQNLYPQLKELNRGWSKQGKLFRTLERYCAENPDTFLFTRPLYSDETWIPSFLDYGIFTRELGLLLNRFNNQTA